PAARPRRGRPAARREYPARARGSSAPGDHLKILALEGHGAVRGAVVLLEQLREVVAERLLPGPIEGLEGAAGGAEAGAEGGHPVVDGEEVLEHRAPLGGDGAHPAAEQRGQPLLRPPANGREDPRGGWGVAGVRGQ